MKVSLRPHHLLCLKGYKGYNYDNNHKVNWNLIQNKLQSSDVDVLVVSGHDDLCGNCPNKNLLSNKRCNDNGVNKLDEAVKSLIGITFGESYKFEKLVQKLNSKITHQLHEKLCSSCVWWQKGLCRDSFE